MISSVILSLALLSAPGPTLHQAVFDKVNELYRVSELPGMTIGYALPDGTSAEIAVGMANMEAKTPMKAGDRLLAGSTGKTFVAAVILQLADEKKLNLDEKIATWLGSEPWFSRLPNSGKGITLRQLLNHSSGVPEYVLEPEFTKALTANPDRVWKPAELVAFILDKPAAFEPGAGFSYADMNFILAAMALEKATGRKMYDLVQERLLSPLKLSGVVPQTSRVIPGLVVGYTMPNSPFGVTGPVVRDGKFVLNPQFEWAGGGFATTAESLARWAKALYEDKVMSADMRAQMVNAIRANTGPNEKYGLGCQVRRSTLGETYGHSGWFPGYMSNMEYFPQEKFAVAVQVNTDEARRMKRPLRGFVLEVANVISAELKKG